MYRVSFMSNHQNEGEYAALTHATYVSCHHPLLQMNPFSHFLFLFSLLLARLGNWILLSAVQKRQSGTGDGQ